MLPHRPHVTLPALALLAAACLTACTSGSSAPAKTSSSTASSSATSASAAPATGRPVDPTTVADRLQAGLATATSAHLAVSTVLAGQTLKGVGDAALSRGDITRADLQQDLPSGLGTIRVVVADGRTYAKLPSALATDSAKPWVVLAADSSNVVVAQLASTVQPVLAVASPASLVAFARAASAATDLGPATVDGTAVTRYRLAVDTAKLPASVPTSITGSGPSVPVEVSLDATGRPRAVSGTFTIRGQAVTPTITLSDYDAPVSVSPPPAAQVSGG